MKGDECYYLYFTLPKTILADSFLLKDLIKW